LLSEPRAEEWLLIEWPEDETEPTKYWFATLPEDIAFDRLVDLAKLRWLAHARGPEQCQHDDREPRPE
jgi:hypothetical protein